MRSKQFAIVEYDVGVSSPQTLLEAEQRIVAMWAADCAEHVLHLFEAEAPTDPRPRNAIARARAYGRGELDTADEIRRRFENGGAARGVSAIAAAVVRSAGQAIGVAHMGAHALGAAGYAVKAAVLAGGVIDGEIAWQLERLSADAWAALVKLPAVGENSAGPLGPGLLSSGQLGTIIREIQSRIRLLG